MKKLILTIALMLGMCGAASADAWCMSSDEELKRLQERIVSL